MSWITESNRIYHLIIGFFSALFGTIIGAIEVACALEGKDCQHDSINANLPPWKWSYRCWDWKDWLATVIGGILGHLVQILIVYLLFFK